MDLLSPKASAMILKWAEELKQPAVGISLIKSAQASPYLASQLNEFQARGGVIFVGEFEKGTWAEGNTITIDPKTVNHYFGTKTDLSAKQFATLFAHELGHVVARGGTFQSSSIHRGRRH